MNKILIVRTDRLGDVLLTTPVATALKERFPQAHIAWWVRPYTAPLLEQNPDVDQIITDTGEPVGSLANRLRSEQFDVALIAFPRWRSAWALWRAGIPKRIGPASKWYTVLFTDRVWQHRSEGKKHEADYNLELLEPLGISFKRYPTRLVLTSEEKTWARKTLEGMRLSFQRPLVVLHPGSGGSSSRWPLAHFMELGDRLQEAGYDVVVTGGPGEMYQSIMIDHMRQIPVFIAAGSVSLRQFVALLAHVNLVVTNSTGPLHIAVALGIPTVSIYSSVVTCHPKRWGPYPAYTEGNLQHEVVLAPDHGLSQADMAKVKVETVWDRCQEKLRRVQQVSVR